MNHFSTKNEYTPSILLVDNNTELTYGLTNNLEVEGYKVSSASDGREGLNEALKNEHDLIILDLVLPSYDGYYILSKVRGEDINIPVLVISDKSEELDKVRSFKLGADDFLSKPFGTMEFLVRIEAILRRSYNHNSTPADYWEFDDIQVNPSSRKVLKCGKSLQMTPLEFDLLVALLQQNGKVMPRQDLLSEVWGHSNYIHSRTVDTHIAELRNKIENIPSRPQYIKTVPKVGYRMEV